MERIGTVFFWTFFGWAIVITGMTFAQQNEVSSANVPRETKSFFDGDRASVEKQLVDLYHKGSLTSKTNYPILRRLTAQKVALDHWTTMQSSWGQNTDPIYVWLEKHPMFLENFLLALDEKHDDIAAAMRIVKHLVTHYPQRVEEYPDLTIAIAVVWDKPGTMGSGAVKQHGATEPPNPADYEELFIYYTGATGTYKFRLQTLPWEVLCYVVSHKTSKAERQWALATYGHDIKMLGKKYSDIRWKTGNPPPLAGKPYTLPNMKQHGGVCTCQADFAVALCRTLSVPAFYCGAGYPKYLGGHSWVMWMEFSVIAPNRFVFTLEQTGRFRKQDYVARCTSPHTRQPEDDSTILLRFHRLGADISAARHSETLTRIYPLIVKEVELNFQEKLKLLLDINAVSPKSPYVWGEIAKLGRENQFTKNDVPIVLNLYQHLLNEFALSPNYLPSLVSDFLSASEFKSQRGKLYGQLFVKLDAKKRPDLILTAVQDFAHAEINDKNEAGALKVLCGIALLYYEEASRIAPVLNLIEQIAAKNQNVYGNEITEFYTQFISLVLKKNKLPSAYRLDMLKRAESCFKKYDQPVMQESVRKEILILQQEKSK